MDCVSEVKVTMDRNRVVPKIICPEALTVVVDKDYIERAFSNFINNSIYFLSKDTKNTTRTLQITAEVHDGTVVIDFNDTGPGVAPNDIPKVFEYLYTTRNKGMGFGLPIARRIIQEHRGDVSIDVKVGVQHQRSRSNTSEAYQSIVRDGALRVDWRNETRQRKMGPQ